MIWLRKEEAKPFDIEGDGFRVPESVNRSVSFYFALLLAVRYPGMI